MVKMQAKYIASIVLAVMAIALAPMVYASATDLIGQLTNSAGTMSNNCQKLMSAKVVIDDVHFTESNKVIVFVRNTGTVTVHVVKVVVRGDGNYYSYDVNPIVSIDPSNITEISVTLDFTWTPGAVYVITVFIDEGPPAECTVTAPST